MNSEMGSRSLASGNKVLDSPSETSKRLLEAAGAGE